MAADDPHFRLRIPVELRDLLRDAAAKNSRSINAEILHRLAMSFPDPDLDKLAREQALKSRERQVEEQVRYLTESLADIREQIDLIKKGGT